MTSSPSIADLLSSTELSEATESVANSSGDFRELVNLLGLEKSHDFVFSNLQGMDFSNADLRGFNFAGADLRGSYGANVLFDDTTKLDDAHVQGSCFAIYKDERELFLRRQDAGTMYETLKSGDPYEVSSWIYARFTDGNDSHPILRNADNDTAAILCQKLLTDEIDLTKRTNLFLHLGRITRSPERMRELLLDILARHCRNIPIMRQFINIAGNLYRNDQMVVQALNMLTRAEDEQIRQTAFIALPKTKFFRDHSASIFSTFMTDENKSIRRRLLTETAISLGRQHLSAINLRASMSEVPLNEILDTTQLLDVELARQIAETLSERERENQLRANDGRPDVKSELTNISPEKLNAVIMRQEEVLCSTPVIRLLFALNELERSRSARARLESQKKRRQDLEYRRSSHLPPPR